MSLGVDGDAISENVSEHGINVIPLWNGLVEDAREPALDDGHPVLGEGASLVAANGGGATHGLARLQDPHKVVIFHHLHFYKES